MNCYDCATQDHLVRAAVAVCHDCGAAVCEHHAVARAHHLARPAVILREEPIEPAARALRCTTCDAAWASLHAPPRTVASGRGTGTARTRTWPDRAR